MIPQIVEKPAQTVVGLEAPFIHALSPQANNAEVIGPLWDKFLQRVQQVPQRAGKEMYGIIYEPAQGPRSHPDELRYIAGVAVSQLGTIPAGMVRHTLSAGTFAVFTHRGPISNIAETCRHIYRVWLPQSAWQHAGTADVELYDDRFQCDRDDSEMEYWIPVTPKTTKT
jgi:AraC family transcriptional regulator